METLSDIGVGALFVIKWIFLAFLPIVWLVCGGMSVAIFLEEETPKDVKVGIGLIWAYVIIVGFYWAGQIS